MPVERSKVKPNHYSVHLEPDLNDFCFRGVASLHIEADEPSQRIVLSANELAIHRCAVQSGDGWLDCAFSIAPERQELVVDLLDKVVGTIHLTIEYAGKIGDQYAGWYRNRYEHKGQIRYAVTTQLAAYDARRLFPCLDHPVQGATFDVEVLIDKNLTAVANTAVAATIPQPEGKKLVRFERTPRMPAFGVFIGVGEFQFLEDNSAQPLVRVVTTPGKTQFGHFALEMARKSLAFYRQFTGIEYPLSKCDLLAVPDSIGAMEHLGAIRFSENALLFQPGLTTESDRVRIANIIAHEIAHLWFGGLVSLADWKYLWLNEAFATYLAHAVVDHIYPEWHVWEQFVGESAQSGLERDALLNTFPIELPPDQPLEGDPAPTPSSAPIHYNKGAAVIRMLAAYLGDEQFQDGIGQYIKRHAFDSVTSQQFWSALSQATGEQAQRFADSWIRQSGYPLVQVERAGDQLHLTQRRFTLSPAPSGGVWTIPLDIISYLDGGKTRRSQFLLDGPEATISLPAQTIACKLNYGQTGFYRVAYDASSLAVLGRLIQAGKLTAIDRYGLQNDLFALVRSGARPLSAYLDFVSAYLSQETHPLPWRDKVGSLAHP